MDSPAEYHSVLETQGFRITLFAKSSRLTILLQIRYPMAGSLPGSSRGLVVRMHDLHTVSHGFKSQKSQRWWQEGHPTLIHFSAPTKSPC